MDTTKIYGVCHNMSQKDLAEQLIQSLIRLGSVSYSIRTIAPEVSKQLDDFILSIENWSFENET